jgi:hypothetical protein
LESFGIVGFALGMMGEVFISWQYRKTQLENNKGHYRSLKNRLLGHRPDMHQWLSCYLTLINGGDLGQPRRLGKVVTVA